MSDCGVDKIDELLLSVGRYAWVRYLAALEERFAGTKIVTDDAPRFNEEGNPLDVVTVSELFAFCDAWTAGESQRLKDRLHAFISEGRLTVSFGGKEVTR